MVSCTPVITTADSDDEMSGVGDELIERESSGSEEGGYDCDEQGSDNTSDEGEWFTCGGERIHSRSCPVNPRDAGNRTGCRHICTKSQVTLPRLPGL